MTFLEQFDEARQAMGQVADGARRIMERFAAEVEFARRLAEAHPDQAAAWEPLILQAIGHIDACRRQGVSFADAVAQAEAMLAPIGAVAKTYTLHCVGHAHIDMNWQWNWPETVALTNDTFRTVDKLMDEFPDFLFSQSQASVYRIAKDYAPEVYARIKQRIAEGRWEVVASQWVEGSKNLASGEILCRHLLYTRQFFAREFGLPADAVVIDWEPDTFGHCATVPTILNAGGVKHYYFHRGSGGPMLFWWEGKDGSRVLAFDDRARGYNGFPDTNITRLLLEFEAETGLRDLPFVYGVGDHGGGPTRRHLRNIEDMATWPIFPRIIFSTAEAFFRIAEQAPKSLPVERRELNFVFEGCYTSQSNVKYANRTSENALVQAEIAAVLAGSLAGMPYPRAELFDGWRHTMFSQFHDILPGSGVHATYEHAQGLFQEILALTGAVTTRAWRAVAARVNTAAVAHPGRDMGANLGAGVGGAAATGGVWQWGAGEAGDLFVVANPLPWARTEVITARLWHRDFKDGAAVVTDETGARIPAQVVSNGNYWGHQFTDIAFPVCEVPATGYRTYAIARSPAPAQAASACTVDMDGRMENAHYRVQVAANTGAIVSLIDKATGLELVPAGGQIGLLEYVREAPHTASAWIIGQIIEHTPLAHGTLEIVERGPHRVALRAQHRVGQSTISVTVALAEGSRRIDFTVEMDWREIGGPQVGVPALHAHFPLAIADTRAWYEVANGHVERTTDMSQLWSGTRRMGYMQSPTHALDVPDVPAQKWMDLAGRHADTDQPVGATLVNLSKYGHAASGGAMRLNLVRSTYEPDPLPELGVHTIRYGLVPHVGPWTPADATREGFAFNQPLAPVGADAHEGPLAPAAGFLEVLSPGVFLSGLKRAEAGEGLVIRLYEANGEAVTARVRLGTALVAPGSIAVQTDVMEQPLTVNTARMTGDVLEVSLPAYGMATVVVEG